MQHTFESNLLYLLVWHGCRGGVCDLDSEVSYVLTDYMQSDLHKIIVSQQPLSPDHIKVFTYQILRGDFLSCLPCSLAAVARWLRQWVSPKQTTAMWFTWALNLVGLRVILDKCRVDFVKWKGPPTPILYLLMPIFRCSFENFIQFSLLFTQKWL